MTVHAIPSVLRPLTWLARLLPCLSVVAVLLFHRDFAVHSLAAYPQVAFFVLGLSAIPYGLYAFLAHRAMKLSLPANALHPGRNLVAVFWVYAVLPFLSILASMPPLVFEAGNWWLLALGLVIGIYKSGSLYLAGAVIWTFMKKQPAAV